ncbi:hypothetical protein, partial [Exiguobacterium antarcticum]|uniref:hypothetical protein n=1 Tax=Exiguobacterium antarcticum TaxID=132920 RepID=UPI0021C4B753
MAETTRSIASGVTPQRLKNLRLWNIGLAILHLGQAASILFLTTDFAIPVISSYIDGPPGAGALVSESR